LCCREGVLVAFEMPLQKRQYKVLQRSFCGLGSNWAFLTFTRSF
jgi:hypothetical protein